MSETLVPSLLVLLLSALVLVVSGFKLTRIVDQLADRLGIGEALAGALLLGATTSLPGLIVTGWTAARMQPDLAVSNALGGIAAQTMFLALADLSYRHANLEHAAASLPNLLQTMILVSLLSLVLLAATGPPLTIPFLRIHPVTAVLPAVYLWGLLLTRRTRETPMWRPRSTSETRCDVPDPDFETAPLPRLLASFLGLAVVVGVCGSFVARAGLDVAHHSQISGTLVGGLLTSIITSLPELVTVLAAVRAGALTLAVGDIIGGNTFDVLFLAVADFSFREGPIYSAIGGQTHFLLGLTILLTGIFAAGLIYRQRTGIGFEGLSILVVYALGFSALVAMDG